MKKFRLMVAAIIFWAGAASAQSGVPQAGITSFNGIDYPSTKLMYDATPDVVSAVVEEVFKQKGFKPSSSKRGFLVFRSVLLPYTAELRTVDAFVQIDEKSRSEKEQSIVSIITAAPNSIPDSKPKKNSIIGNSVVVDAGSNDFLLGITPAVAQKEHLRRIGVQQEMVAKAEKKLQDLKDDQRKLEERIEKLKKEIEENKGNQERQARQVEDERKKLQDLKSQNIQS